MSYYDVEQALEVFKNNLPEPMLPFDLPQLADLCRQGILTPVFPYHLYTSKPCHYEDNGRPRYAPTDTNKFNGYLTHDHLISLIDGYTNSLSLSYAANIEGENNILLFDKYQPYPEDADTNPFTVTLENIRLSVDEVQSYITLQYFDDLTTPEQSRIAELESELADLKQQSNQKADNTVNSLLTAIHDKNNEHHAPDLSHSIKLWNDLYINGQIGTDSHSNKADIWINTNTGYGDNAKSSTDRIKEISSPSKHWSPHRKKEIKK